MASLVQPAILHITPPMNSLGLTRSMRNWSNRYLEGTRSSKSISGLAPRINVPKQQRTRSPGMLICGNEPISLSPCTCHTSHASSMIHSSSRQLKLQTRTVQTESSLPRDSPDNRVLHPLAPKPLPNSIASTSNQSIFRSLPERQDDPLFVEPSSPTSSSSNSAPPQAELRSVKPKSTSSIQQSKSKTSRPAKQVITLTPRAIEQLIGLLDGPEPKLIRVGVKNKGCAGMAYHLEYIDKPGKFDEVVRASSSSGREVKMMIDSRALFSIIGSEMDWEETQMGNRFVFNNPNVKEQCGCGESFMV